MVRGARSVIKGLCRVVKMNFLMGLLNECKTMQIKGGDEYTDN